MFDLDRWHEIFNAISKNKLRSVLTAFGVFWAVFMLIVLSGSGNGLVNGVTNGFKNFETNSAFIWARPTTEAFLGYKRNRIWELDNKDILSVKDQITEISSISPRLYGANTKGNVVNEKLAGSYSVVGDYPSYILVDPSNILFGRYINEEDIRLKRKICTIGTRVYESLFKRGEDPTGKYIRVNGVYFMVVGVISSKSPTISGNSKETVTIPFTTMQQTYNFGDKVQYFAFVVPPGVVVADVIKKVELILKKNHKISPTDNFAIGNSDLQEIRKSFTYVQIGINVLIWIVGLGTLISGAVGVGNIMLVVVKERTKEIGIMRALGASPRIIVSQILLESIFLTAVAGFIGMAFSTLLLHGIDTIFDIQNSMRSSDEFTPFLNPGIDWIMAFTSTLILIVIGFIAGLIPALKAMRIKPIEALRAD